MTSDSPDLVIREITKLSKSSKNSDFMQYYGKTNIYNDFEKYLGDDESCQNVRNSFENIYI
jgi:hypothetical protein